MQGFLVGTKGNQLEKAIEEAREKMHTSINVNGESSLITIELSQELDKLIVKEQLRRISS